jgi:DNA repair exonuclease SbcCD nuclease subunit
MRYLVIGDPHVTPSELPDCEKLLEFVLNVVKTEKVDKIVFLGDLFHSHGVVHLQVLDFWTRWMIKLSVNLGQSIISLVGNHDQDLRNPQLNALSNLPDVISATPDFVDEECLFVSYHGHKNQEAFINLCSQHPDKVLICHETFQGAQYDNGFYAKDGIDSDLVPNKVIISGHIHTRAKFGKVIYPGSPRWRTMSDANIEKAIYIFDIKKGKIKEVSEFRTDTSCTPIYQFSIPRDQEKYDKVKNSGAKIVLTVSGTEAEVSKIKENIEVPDGVMIKENISSSSDYEVKESLGITTEFNRFKESFVDGKVLNKEYFEDVINNRIVHNL